MTRSRSVPTWMLVALSLGSSGCLDFGDARDSFCEKVDPERRALLCPEKVSESHVLTFSARALGPRGGMLRLDSLEAACSAPCDSHYEYSSEPGGTLTLTALPESGVSFHWSGACKGSNPTCTLPRTASHDVTLTFTPYNYVFVTSSGWNRTSGVRGADELCAQQARRTGLPGTYRAWLSTSTTPALARLDGASGWIRLDGLPFATSLAELNAGHTLYPVALDESQQLASRTVVTGTQPDGSVAMDNNCGDWASSGVVTLGDPLSAGASFSSCCLGSCASAEQGEYAVYCFGVDRSTEVTFFPTQGRLAFVSSGTFVPSEGLAGADALCQREARERGWSSPDGFAALLSTASASAASRFDSSPGTLPWVRPDGVRLVQEARELFDATRPLLAPLNMDSQGGYVDSPLVALGSTSPAVAASPGQDCNGWSSREPASRFLGGHARNVRFTQEPVEELSCATLPHVLCLQR
jgi:hypothetical protein